MALYSYRFFPEKKYLLTAAAEVNPYIYGVNLPNGRPSGLWLNEGERKFRCIYPAGIPDYGYYCSFNLGYEVGENRGVDLSRYSAINLSIEYTGTAPKMRLFARNFDKRYSNSEDVNSTKYNAIFLSTKELRHDITVKLSEFVVTEWWLMTYGIDRQNSYPQLNNVVNFGVDFSDSMTVGNHDVKVNKIEFVGEWISRENWYLLIVCVWLVSVFFNTINRLRVFRKLKIQDEKVILALNESNKNLVKETDKFRKLSTVDALTQSYNRFGIDQIVSTLITPVKDVAVDEPPFSLILLDIDHFKRVNDTRGHDTGDRVLKNMAKIINGSLREGDYIGRWGGEEFVIILPFTRHEFAMALAEKIRISVSHSSFEPENPLLITVSVGVGSLLSDESFADLFKRVDEALYRAKERGRNCCIVAEPQFVDYLGAKF